MNKKTILLIEDDELDVISVERTLKKLDTEYNLHIAHNGKEALGMLTRSEDPILPDVILLDLNMPGMMGLQVLKELKANKTWKPIPVIVLTTSTLEKDRESSYEMGASCFLRKPVAFDELALMTSSIVNLWFNDKKIHQKADL